MSGVFKRRKNYQCTNFGCSKSFNHPDEGKCPGCGRGDLAEIAPLPTCAVCEKPVSYDRRGYWKGDPVHANCHPHDPVLTWLPGEGQEESA